MSAPHRRSSALTVRILGRDYPIACPDEECAALRDSAAYLDARTKAIAASGKALDNERIAIMAALNITRELLDLQSRGAGNSAPADAALTDRLAELQNRIEAALSQDDQSDDDAPSR